MNRSASKPAILVADDDLEMCQLAEAALSRLGYSVAYQLSPAGALSLLDREDYAVLLADIQMEGMTGLELCQRALEKRPDLVVVVMTGFGSVEHAVAAMHAGAYDFLTKPVSIDALAVTIERAARHRSMSDELRRLRRTIEDSDLTNVIGESEAVRKLADLVNRVAPTDTNVLITGESGTGKELVARAIHERSERRGPFLAINCAAVPETLLESELFGHVRGAFTDARSSRSGLFVQANGGTLFLDEIGEMPAGMQAKILRALQERKVRPVGSTAEVPFDVRLITATNRDLKADVDAKKFREDLYYRVNVVHIPVPPLRERGDDVLILAKHFLERAAAQSNKSACRLGRRVAERLLSYDWPGNVRELENCVERAVAFARSEEITLEDIPLEIRDHRPMDVYPVSNSPEALWPIHDVEKRYIQRVLEAVKGNKTMAAKVLGFDRRTLYRKLREEDEPDA